MKLYNLPLSPFLSILILPIELLHFSCFSLPTFFFSPQVEVSPPLVGDIVPGEAIMDQPPINPNMSGQVASEEVVEEPGEIPDPSMAKDPKSEQVPDLSITRDPKGA